MENTVWFHQKDQLVNDSWFSVDEMWLLGFEVQTLSDLSNGYVPGGMAHITFCEIWNWVYIWSNMFVCRRESSWNPNFWTQDPDWPQHDCPASCVVAQQYSSATFVSLHFHSHKQKFSLHFKMVLFQIKFLFYFLKLHKSETA